MVYAAQATSVPLHADRASARGQAFTLIELLVVVAVISILASLTMPTVLRSMRLSEKAQCKSNHMQLGHATKAYGVSNATFLPPFGYYVVGDSPPWYEPFWSCNLASFLYPHLGYDERLMKVTRCPTLRQSSSWYARGITCNYGKVFAYQDIKHLSSSGHNGSMQLPAIHRPSTTILLMDGNYGFNYSPCIWTRQKDMDGDGILDTNNGTNVMYNGGAPFRHDGTINILCADGHVESITAQEWLTNNKRFDPDR